MTAVWPSAITIHQLFPLSIAAVEQRAVFKPEEGPAKFAAGATDPIFRVQFDVLMSGTNVVNDFLTWWEGDLNRGAERFTGLEHVVTDAPATYVFADAMPNFTLLRGAATAGGRIWRATFNLWALPVAIGGGGSTTADSTTVTADDTTHTADEV